MSCRMRVLFAVLLPVAGLSWSGCGEERLGFAPPLLMNTAGLSGQVELDDEPLVYDAPRHGIFPTEFLFRGHVFATAAGARVGLRLDTSRRDTSPALAVYGPRTSDGLFGRPLVHAVSSGGQEVSITELHLDEGGDYLVLVHEPTVKGGDYSLLLACAAGCQPPSCDPLVCTRYCVTGLQRDEAGCPRCACAPGCASDADCPLEFACGEDGVCRRRQEECGCQDGYDPVCGADGRTYANQCELECAGVALDHPGACQVAGCAGDTDCPAGMACRDGHCESACACDGEEYDPVCGTDGVTYPSDCERQCAGVALDHLGSCDQCNAEVCDGVDNDCDGVIDEGCAGSCNADSDCAPGEVCWAGSCIGGIPCTTNGDCPAGQVCQGGLCHGQSGCAPEVCDGVDNDCDGGVDEGCPACRSDADCPQGQVCQTATGRCIGDCVDDDGDGWTTCAGDCDDLDAGVFPGAAESCDDAVDNDCDGQTDEGCPGKPCASDDDCQAGLACIDGMCSGAASCATDEDCQDAAPCETGVCTGGTCSYEPVSDGTACDDGESCTADDTCRDGVCSGVPIDEDGDGSSLCDGDCDDTDPGVGPGQTEICDGIDNDCDGEIDEGCGTSCSSDADCAAGQACCAGICTDISSDPANCGGCGMACGAGESCVDGVCIFSCSADADCDDGDPGTEDSCVAGVCVHLRGCASDADCPATQMCHDNVCLGEGGCASDADCDDGWICDANGSVCVLACRSDDECQAGQVCQAGLCAP